MAAFETTRPLNDSVRLGAHTYALFVNTVGRIVEWNDRRVTRNALSTLSTRELEDIGLSRGDVAEM
ncbi:MAG: DUF1127 domain-containing protein [Litoreibacter sp.]|nr:DUF1127 domain-containing protein [Litoreibacter sp.]